MEDSLATLVIKPLSFTGIMMKMLCAIDRSAPSINGAALSIDPLLVQALIYCTSPSVDGFGAGRTDWRGPSCTFNHHFNWD